MYHSLDHFSWKGSQRALKAEREHRAANKRLLQKELAEIQQQYLLLEPYSINMFAHSHLRHAKQLAEMQQHLHMREEEAQRLLDELQDVQSVSANQITSLQRMLDAATSTGLIYSQFHGKGSFINHKFQEIAPSLLRRRRSFGMSNSNLS